jgi:hypothetical protein
MSDLKHRLRNLERQLANGPPSRCDVCRDWPEQRTDYTLAPQYQELAGIFRAKWGNLQPDPPERCPSCGWEPVTVVMVERDYGPQGVRI